MEQWGEGNMDAPPDQIRQDMAWKTPWQYGISSYANPHWVTYLKFTKYNQATALANDVKHTILDSAPNVTGKDTFSKSI